MTINEWKKESRTQPSNCTIEVIYSRREIGYLPPALRKPANIRQHWQASRSRHLWNRRTSCSSNTKILVIIQAKITSLVTVLRRGKLKKTKIEAVCRIYIYRREKWVSTSDIMCLPGKHYKLQKCRGWHHPAMQRRPETTIIRHWRKSFRM